MLELVIITSQATYYVLKYTEAYSDTMHSILFIYFY